MLIPISLNLRQHRLVKLCAVYTFLGWLASELTLILNCHPVSGYWTLPPPQRECATYFRFEIVQCVFNISSDIAILLVILPMLLRTRMPWRTKLPVLVVFAMGIVVVSGHLKRKGSDGTLTPALDYLRYCIEVLYIPRHLRPQLPILVHARSLDRSMGDQRTLHLGHGTVNDQFPPIIKQHNLRQERNAAIRHRPTISRSLEAGDRDRLPIDPRSEHKNVRHRDDRRKRREYHRDGRCSRKELYICRVDRRERALGMGTTIATTWIWTRKRTPDLEDDGDCSGEELMICDL